MIDQNNPHISLHDVDITRLAKINVPTDIARGICTLAIQMRNDRVYDEMRYQIEQVVGFVTDHDKLENVMFMPLYGNSTHVITIENYDIDKPMNVTSMVFRIHDEEFTVVRAHDDSFLKVPCGEQRYCDLVVDAFLRVFSDGYVY